MRIRSMISRVLFSFLIVLALNSVFVATVFADQPVGATFLPENPYTTMNDVPSCLKALQMPSFEIEKQISSGDNSREQANAYLSCAIRTGNIKLWMIPYFIRYILEVLLGISGLVAVGGIIYGGFSYIFAGLSENQEQAKKAIIAGIIGLILTLTAWAIVNIVITLVTSI